MRLLLSYILLFSFYSCHNSLYSIYKREVQLNQLNLFVEIHQDGTFLYNYYSMPEGANISGVWERIGDTIIFKNDSMLPIYPDTLNIYSLYKADYSNWLEIFELYYDVMFQCSYYKILYGCGKGYDKFLIKGKKLWPVKYGLATDIPMLNLIKSSNKEYQAELRYLRERRKQIIDPDSLSK